MKLGLISLGCSKNLVDSEYLIGTIINKKGFSLTNNIDEADIILINTCGFIGDAKEESIETILEVVEKKKKWNIKKVIVAGCLAQRYAQELLDEIPEIDAVLGTGELDKIEKIVDDILINEKCVQCDSLNFLANAETNRYLTTKPHTAYLKIAEGCNRRCTYCIIPQLRGNLRSRTIEDIVLEAKNLAKVGIRELNVLAQETTEYGLDIYKKKNLASLLKELIKVDGIKWIRLYYMFPNSLDEELIKVIKNEEKICKYFDVPIQHISDNILQNMSRAKSGEHIKKILRKIRDEIPEATIRTTVIVGFPGETEADFEELKTFIKDFEFDYVGVFKYSREEGTVAYDLENQVSEEIKEKRMIEIVNLQAQIVEMKNKKMIGKIIDVMLDGISEESEYMLEGRTAGQALDIDGKILTTDGTGKIGEIVKVKIEQNFEYDYTGIIVENEIE